MEFFLNAIRCLKSERQCTHMSMLLDDFLYGARFRQQFILEDAIGFPPSRRVTNGIPLGCLLLLPVDTVNSVQILKVGFRLFSEHERFCCNVRVYSAQHC
jgi:hypothetical protein